MKEWNAKKIFVLLWQNKKFIIILSILCMIGGYIQNCFFTKPEYMATSSIILSVTQSTIDEMGESNERTISAGDISLSEQLMNTYVQIIKSDSVLEKVINNLQLNMSVKQLKKAINIVPESKSTVMKIYVTSTDSDQALRIMDELEIVFFDRIEELYNIKSSKVLDTPNVEQAPSNINPIKHAFFGFLIGFIAAASIVLIREVFNDNIKTENEIEKNLKIQVLAAISHFSEKYKVVTLMNYNTVVEQFRVLVSNINVLKSKSVVVVSNMPGEGKSVVSANLAATYASSGKKTLLIDSDMRRGTQHQIFGIKNQYGLSNLIFDNSMDYERHIQKDVIPNLDILTKGSANLNYSKLLFSDIIEKILTEAKEKYDFIVVDGTPCQIVADGTVLYKMVDSAIIVVKYNNTKCNDVLKIKRIIKQNGGKVLGAILNDIPGATGKYSSYYGYGDKEMITTDKKINNNNRNM